MEIRDSQQLIDMDKGGEGLGPLFEEPKRRLQDEPAFRAAWAQYQAVKALAWEAAPELDERLVRQAIQASRRQEVERRLARSTGSADAARELLLQPESEKRGGLPAWAAFLLLIGAIGLGWMAFGPGNKGTSPSAPTPPPTAPAESGLDFEFPAGSSGRAAALDASAPPDDAHVNDAAMRQARRLVNENLRAAAQPKDERPEPEPTAVKSKPKPTKPRVHAAPTKPVPRSTPSPTPADAEAPQLLPSPTAGSAVDEPTLVPSPAATAAPAVPTQVPSPAASAPSSPAFVAVAGSSSEASLTLSGTQFPAQAIVSLPEAGNVDLRLFDMRGRLVRRYAEGDQAAGRWRVDLAPVDDLGHPLPSGSYYLRAITRWFSKVEAIDQP